MRKIVSILCSFTLLCGANIFANQDSLIREKIDYKDTVVLSDSTRSDSLLSDTTALKVTEAIATPSIAKKVEQKEIREVIKQKFIEGGVGFMSIVLICLIFGLAIAIERIIMLGLASTNLQSVIDELNDALDKGGVEEARRRMKEIPGPVAAIYSQGLARTEEGLEGVEKAVISYGSVEMGKLEKGLTWVSLFISLAPMLGFMGTVIGMIAAFDSIVTAGTIEIDEVAKGIKVALLTTVAGLIVAIILQVFYNFIVSKIDAIVNEMEEGSVALIDSLITNELVNKK
jgi:biopolymer transport protein ExbB